MTPGLVYFLSLEMGVLDFRHEFLWLNGKNEFLWMSEKDGWSHIYRISKDGAREILITKGDYDVIDFLAVDEKSNYVYFNASPANATQKYLYKTKLDGKGKLELVTPAGLEGTHGYDISPNSKFAQHSFSNMSTRPVSELVDLVKYKALDEHEGIQSKLTSLPSSKKAEFFKTEEGYIYMSVDGRGTPAPKGRAWRKSIYRKIGQLNIRDQALAAKEILKWSFVDPERIAVWGWSGGGSATLNLLFQYPEIYKTGIAGAAVANQLTYDNIYQERYMGLPQENLQDIVNGSPVTHAKNLKGNLLYIHGTGDDNVHYNNAEMLINELIKYNKQFQMMAYPNRSHGMSEGEGTFEHLATLGTEYLKKHCPPGGR